MEPEYDDDVDDARLQFITVDVDLYLKDIITVKKPRRITIDDDK